MQSFKKSVEFDRINWEQNPAVYTFPTHHQRVSMATILIQSTLNMLNFINLKCRIYRTDIRVPESGGDEV